LDGGGRLFWPPGKIDYAIKALDRKRVTSSIWVVFQRKRLVFCEEKYWKYDLKTVLRYLKNQVPIWLILKLQTTFKTSRSRIWRKVQGLCNWTTQKPELPV